MVAVYLLIIAAFSAWFVMFSPWTSPYVPFWYIMCTTCFILGVSALIAQKKQLSQILSFKLTHILFGLGGAALLYIAFYIGHKTSTHILPFAALQVQNIYTIKNGVNPAILGLLLFFLIGPAEEIFWRGFVQERFMGKFGLVIGTLSAAAIYTLVHIWSFNFMLICAAALCGLFWSIMYAYCKSIWPGIISHAVWDVMIFILLPIN